MNREACDGESIPAIMTRGLRKEFGDLVAVKDLDMKVEKGVLYGMIGPNGSGKTTTIRMLIGLLRATSGEAFLMGEPLPLRKNMSRVGYMPQELAIYTDLTVHENVEFFARMYSVNENGMERREREILEMVDLWERKDSLVQNLSGGMRHRTSLACALIHDPDLLFLDEPTVGVDPELRVGFWDFFDRLTDRGKTVIITTHYMDEAVRCDRVGMMRQGDLIAEGSPEELMSSVGVKNLEEAFLIHTGRCLE